MALGYKILYPAFCSSPYGERIQQRYSSKRSVFILFRHKNRNQRDGSQYTAGGTGKQQKESQ